jgi:hypothetical protein
MKILVKILVPTLLLLALASTALAQSQANQSKNSGQNQKNEMQALNFLTGTWQGQGWIIEGADNQRHTFYQTEQVQYKLEGNLLLIEGTGYTDQSKSRLADAALAVVTYNANKGNYDWRAYQTTQEGTQATDAEATVKDSTLVWAMTFPDVTIQYTISVNEQGQWHEVGKVSQDGGKTWFQNFEMTLNKQNK